MRIGYEDADSLITYPRAHNLSGCEHELWPHILCSRALDGAGARNGLLRTADSNRGHSKGVAPARMSGGHPFSIQPMREAFTSRRKRGP